MTHEGIGSAHAHTNTVCKFIVQVEEAKWQADLEAWRSGYQVKGTKESNIQQQAQPERDVVDKASPVLASKPGRRGSICNSITGNPLSDPNNRLAPLPRPPAFDPVDYQ